MKNLILIAGLIFSFNTMASSVGEAVKPECEYINQSKLGQEQTRNFDSGDKTKVETENGSVQK